MHIRKFASIYLQIKIDYLSHNTVSAHRSLLINGCLVGYDKVQPFFANNCERTGVWAAFFNCNFEEGPAPREVPSKVVIFSDIHK